MPETAPYFAAFRLLARDRPQQSLSMGMAGGVLLPRPVPRETIRQEGKRLGYEGDALEDFTEIVARIDDFQVEVDTKRAAEEARRAATRARTQGR